MKREPADVEAFKEWLNSPAGQKEIQASLAKANKQAQDFRIKSQAIDPAILNKPMTI